ncbi:DUF6266 family protein [Daejeonella sp.]|uniref:DUF6266 family protein n=1 Tax=Daejeonella sp. TaxID=2805397 RepID=UPI0030C16355
MAKYYKGVIGPISGKVGDKVYTIRNGQAYVQSKPKRSTKPPTTAQIIQRARFGMVAQFVGPIRNILNQTYSKINRKKEGVNVAIQQIHADAIIGEYPDFEIDFAKVTLTRGRLSAPILEMSYSEEHCALQLSWSTKIDFNSFHDDELIAMIYCPSLPEKWMILETGIYRADEKGLIKIPAELSNREIHTWLFYRSRMQDSYSQCNYPGNFYLPQIDGHGNE